MFFRPIEPRGDVLEATRHSAAIGLLFPLTFATVAVQLWFSLPQSSAGASIASYLAQGTRQKAEG